MAHVFLGPESAQDEHSSFFFSRLLLKNSTKSQFYPGFPKHFPRFTIGVRRITARERSTVTCASKTPSKIDKNMLNLHFVREWHTFFWAQSQLKMKICRFFPMFLLKNSAKSQFYSGFSKIFPTSLALWVF